MNRKIILLLPIVLIPFLFLSCGYKLRGTGNFLPSYMKSVYIPEFKNKTSRVDLGRIITEEVISSFISRGNFKLSNSENSAEGKLKGEIISFIVIPINADGSGGSKYKVKIKVKVEFVDLKKGEIIYKNPSFYYEDEYDTLGGGDFLSKETESIRKIAEQLSVSLVNTILEGF